MSLVKKEYEAASSADALGEAVKNVLIATDTALKNGWQPMEDLPVIATAALTSLLGAAAELKNISGDASGAPFAFGKGIVIPIIEGVEVILKK